VTPDQIPAELKQILHDRAGKQHSDDGPVMAALAEILVRHAELLYSVEHQRYKNTLTWIRHVAGLHYFGGAFNPEHMRDLANMATAALQGKDFPDYDQSIARAQETAAEWVALFAAMADGPDGEEEDVDTRGETPAGAAGLRADRGPGPAARPVPAGARVRAA